VSWRETRITRLLGIELPLVGAPMATASTPELAAAVSNAGGLGSLGGAYTPPDRLRADIRRVRELTDRPFAVNLFAWGPVADADAAPLLAELATVYAELGLEAPAAALPFDPPSLLAGQLDVVAAERVPVFSFTFGIPPLDAVRAAGAVVAGTATTADEAAALESAGVDVVVAQGSEAGGHRGTFLHPAAEALVGGLALVPQVVDRVGVPVLAAGGIMDGRGIAAALALGADGVQLGTAFLATPESAASEAHKAALAGTADGGTTVTDAFTGRHARAIRTGLWERLERSGLAALPFPLQGALVTPLARAAAAQGRPELGFFLAGQAAALSRRTGAAELVAALAAETDAAIARL
jgi:nitronate monooxygenase